MVSEFGFGNASKIKRPNNSTSTCQSEYSSLAKPSCIRVIYYFITNKGPKWVKPTNKTDSFGIYKKSDNNLGPGCYNHVSILPLYKWKPSSWSVSKDSSRLAKIE
jgi:hypothetical protein